MGIGKRALMEDYYIDEVGEVMAQWGRLHGVEPDGECAQDDITAFLDL